MKKLVLGLILVAVLVAVSYFKSGLDATQYSEGYKEGWSKKAGDGQSDTDSLDQILKLERQASAERDLAWQDSLAERDSLHAGTVDSLRLQVATQDVEITGLRKQVSTPAVPSMGEEPTASKARHVDILKFYREAVARLPKDLSDYERRVEVSEIRDITASKFSITVKRLNEIRDQYKIAF